MSPQVSRSITAQTSSSGSSDAEVAELAGASIEENTEIKRRAEQQQQVMPGRAADELSDQRPSTEEDDDAEGKKKLVFNTLKTKSCNGLLEAWY